MFDFKTKSTEVSQEAKCNLLYVSTLIPHFFKFLSLFEIIGPRLPIFATSSLVFVCAFFSRLRLFPSPGWSLIYLLLRQRTAPLFSVVFPPEKQRIRWEGGQSLLLEMLGRTCMQITRWLIIGVLKSPVYFFPPSNTVIETQILLKKTVGQRKLLSKIRIYVK